MPPKKPKSELEISVSAAATPARVLAAARMIQAALQAANDKLVDASVTMVVENLQMRIEVRPQNRAGRAAVKRIRDVMKNPLREVQKHPASQIVAKALARESSELAPDLASVIDPSSKKVIATIDKKFVGVMEAAGQQELRPGEFLVGRTELHTQIYRVGRVAKSPAKIEARIQVDGKLIEVPIERSEDLIRRLFDYSRDRKAVRVGVECRWLRSEEDAWILDGHSLHIVSAYEMDPAPGRVALDELTAATARSAEETREWIEDIRGDS